MNQDVSTLLEEDAAKQWEELNADTNEFEGYLIAAGVELAKACNEMNTALDSIASAIDALKDCTEESDKVTSYLNNLEDIMCDLRSMRDHYERAEFT